MVRITLPDVLVAICKVLDHRFGYEVFTDEIKQGFQEPCFFIETVYSSQEMIGKHRHRRRQTFCIHFFPADDEKNMNILSMTEILYEILEYITVIPQKKPKVSCVCRGSKMSHKEVSGILHFLVDYHYDLIEVPEPSPYMEKLKQSFDTGRSEKNGKKR